MLHAHAFDLRSLVCVLALFVAMPANALLSETDLSVVGDGLLTFDSDTNLEWLDLTPTTSLSFDDIAGGAGGWLALGFRVATETELAGLWANAGISDTSGAPTNGNRAGVELLLNLMGCTFSCGAANEGAQGQVEFDPAQAVLNGPFLQLFGGSQARADIDPGFSQTRDFSNSTLGTYLVRNAIIVPEPATAVLVISGLMSLGFAGRKRR